MPALIEHLSKAKQTEAKAQTRRALSLIRHPALAHKPADELGDVTDALTFYCGSILAPLPKSHDHTATLIYHYSSPLCEAITQQQPATPASSWPWYTLCRTSQITFILSSSGLHKGRWWLTNSHLLPWHSYRLTSVHATLWTQLYLHDYFFVKYWMKACFTETFKYEHYEIEASSYLGLKDKFSVILFSS